MSLVKRVLRKSCLLPSGTIGSSLESIQIIYSFNSNSVTENRYTREYSSSIGLPRSSGQRNGPSVGSVQLSRQFSIIPSSWGIRGGSKDSSQEERSNEVLEESNPGTQDIEHLTQSAASTGVDDLVDLARVAEKAALEAAMEGSWLPTRTLQWILETVHHGSGLAWWQSIMLTTVGIRAATFPIMLMQIKNTYRLSQARPEIEHLVAHLKEEQARGNPNATSDYQQQVMRVWKKYNANPLKSMASIFVQAPLLIGFFSALRGLAAAKVPSLAEGGTLWFHDLTVADPTYALPIISAASFLLMVELNAADGMEGQTDKMRSRFKNIMRGVAVLIVPFTVDLPAGVFMYWTASNMVSLVQSSVLKIPSVKRTFGIPVLQKVHGTRMAQVSSHPASTVNLESGTPPILYTQKPTKSPGKNKAKKPSPKGKSKKK